MRILDGKMALGNKSGTKNLGEHKVGALSISFPTSDHYHFVSPLSDLTKTSTYASQ